MEVHLMIHKRNIIRECVDANAALDLVMTVANGEQATIGQKMYYPYFQYNSRCSVPGLFGRRTAEITCLVDAVNGLGATAGRYHVDSRHLPYSELIDVAISGEKAARAAQRTVTHRLTRRLRVIAPFDLELEPKGIIYKGFWIVRSASATVMVDSVNGGLHPLNMRAA
jgi:hypothetical protein